MTKNNNVTLTGSSAQHRLAALRFYAGGYVLNTMSGMFYGLTPAADFLLRSLDAGASLQDLPDLIQKQYGLQHAIAVRDAELLVNQLSALDLIAPASVGKRK